MKKFNKTAFTKMLTDITKRLRKEHWWFYLKRCGYCCSIDLVVYTWPGKKVDAICLECGAESLRPPKWEYKQPSSFTYKKGYWRSK